MTKNPRCDFYTLIAFLLPAILPFVHQSSAVAANNENAVVNICRMDDAQRLSAQAATLIEQTTALKKTTLDLIAQTAAKSQSAQQQNGQYEQLLTAYQDALSAYLKHRMEFQQHVSAFHRSSQMDKALDTPIQVMPYTPLAGAVQMHCEAMQFIEKRMIMLETQLRDLFEILIQQRSQTPTPDYTAKINMAKSLITDHHGELMSFENDLMNKQGGSSDQMHDQIHLAMISGDYVESEKIYKQMEQRNGMVQGEAERAQYHLGMSHLFVQKLNLLSNPADLAGQSQSTGVFDEIPDADNELEKEYARVQQLYQQVQNARPHK